MKQYKFALFRKLTLTCWHMLVALAALAVAAHPLAALPELVRTTLAANPMLALGLGVLLIATGFLGSSRLYDDYSVGLTYWGAGEPYRKSSRKYLLYIIAAVGKIAVGSLVALLVTVLWYGSVEASATNVVGHVNAVLTLGATVASGTLLTCCIALLLESPPPRK